MIKQSQCTRVRAKGFFLLHCLNIITPRDWCYHSLLPISKIRLREVSGVPQAHRAGKRLGRGFQCFSLCRSGPSSRLGLLWPSALNTGESWRFQAPSTALSPTWGQHHLLPQSVPAQMSFSRRTHLSDAQRQDNTLHCWTGQSTTSGGRRRTRWAGRCCVPLSPTSPCNGRRGCEEADEGRKPHCRSPQQGDTWFLVMTANTYKHAVSQEPGTPLSAFHGDIF